VSSDRIPYRPSNGTEGDIFMSRWCAQCKADQARREGDEDDDGCLIVVMTMAVDIAEPDYPKEWRSDGPSGPRCTAFAPVDGDEAVPIDPAAAVRPLI